MSADTTARMVIEQIPNLPEFARQYMQAVARGEGFYGLGWATPSAQTIKLSHSKGLTGLEGAGSNNWGADQGQGTAGSFPHIDFHADGSLYVGQYARYNTALEGASRYGRILLKPNVLEALKRGSLREAVFAQHANRYFELDPEKYLQAVKANYAKVIANTGLRPVLSEYGDGGPLSEADAAPQSQELGS